MVFRVKDPSEKTDAQRLAEWEVAGSVGERPALRQVQWKLEWRQLGQAAWVQTMEASTPIVRSAGAVGDYQLIDCGEARPERPITGGPRFEWRLQACVPPAGPQGSLQPLIRDVYPMTTEQWQRVADTTDPPIDGEPSAYAGAAADNTGVGTTAWTNEAGGAVGAPGAHFSLNHVAAGGISHYLELTNFGLPVPAGATPRGVRFAVLVGAGGDNSIYDYRVRLIKGGVVKEAEDKASGMGWPNASGTGTGTAWRYFGGTFDLWGQTLSQSDVVASNFGLAFAVRNAAASQVNAGIYGVLATVAYTEGSNENRVCFATRSVEFSDTGTRRQHITDEVWGELIPDGLDLQAPVPGQAAQPMRALVVPSVGDFDSRPDSATAKVDAKLWYRPGYLSAREAKA
jgi:hypothetical protein